MHRPELYVKSNTLQSSSAGDILDEFLPKLNWTGGPEYVVDIGSGSGDVTSGVMRPRLSAFAAGGLMMRGLDVSQEMVKFANQRQVALPSLDLP